MHVVKALAPRLVDQLARGAQPRLQKGDRNKQVGQDDSSYRWRDGSPVALSPACIRGMTTNKVEQDDGSCGWWDGWPVALSPTCSRNQEVKEGAEVGLVY